VAQGSLVSVIMPVFNAGSFLQPAIESVLTQSYRNLELIVVDDGSTDGATDGLAEHPDERVVYVRNEVNIGAAQSRNRAIELARGHFIAIQDADDLSTRTRLADSLSLFDSEPDVCVVYGNHVFIDMHDRAQGCTVLPETHQGAALGFRSSQPFGHGSVMVRRACVIQAGGYDSAFEPAEDYALFAGLLLGGCVFRGMSRDLYQYRLNTAGISTTGQQRLVDARALVSTRVRSARVTPSRAFWTHAIAAEPVRRRGQPRLRMIKDLVKESRLDSGLATSTALLAVCTSAGPKCLSLLAMDTATATERRIMATTRRTIRRLSKGATRNGTH
jgi:glycosyltransferase involved in cell wall biosynthesis